jgi:hypothetical protein
MSIFELFDVFRHSGEHLIVHGDTIHETRYAAPAEECGLIQRRARRENGEMVEK